MPLQAADCVSVSELANVDLVYSFHHMLSLLLVSMESHYFTAYKMDWPYDVPLKHDSRQGKVQVSVNLELEWA